MVAEDPVATVTTGLADEAVRSLHGGERAALATVIKTAEQGALRVMAAVQDRLEAARADAPEGVRLEIAQDSTRNIVERLDIIAINGVQGRVLVVAGLLFSLRFSFWVALTLAVSFLGIIFVVQLLAGISINMITIIPLLIAIGLLMDDSILISENIVRRRRAGERPLEAAVNGIIQVLPGIASSFLTTVLIVGPLGLVAGRIGEVLKFPPIVLVIVLVISLIEAFNVLPNHLGHALKRPMTGSAVTRATNGVFDTLRDRIVIPLARAALRFRYLGLALVVTAFVPIAAGWLRFQSFPTLKSDTVEAQLVLPQETPVARIEERVATLLAALERLDAEKVPRQPDGERLVRAITGSFGTNPDAPAESGAHLATISVGLFPAGTRATELDRIEDRWRELAGPLPDIVALRFSDREAGPAGSPST